MKTITFKILFFNIIFIFAIFNSQTIIVRGQNNGNLPEDFNSTGQYYYKDVYNYLDNFVGTWEYVNGNEKFQIILTKIIKYHTNIPNIKLNFYEDGIAVRYKKFQNGNLVFESPLPNEPSFTSQDGQKLEGYIVDYGRVTVDVNWPTVPTLGPQGVFKHGGEYFHPTCIIEKMPLILNHPQRIKFKLYLGKPSAYGIGNEYNNPAYNGLPTFSIPNMVVMKKVL
ncbi:DUF6705 family protein [Chryseobacterium taihuense]|nr:DUF6705 family protein [Chryseobacterium taihuense]